MYLQNAPEFLFVWHGLISIGCAPAFINYNIVSDALVHCIKVSGAKILLVDSEAGCQERIRGSVDRIISELGVKPITLSEDLQTSIATSEAGRPPDSLRLQVQDKVPLCLIYTRYFRWKDVLAEIVNLSTAELLGFPRPFQYR